jgi:hypothetical protein
MAKIDKKIHHGADDNSLFQLAQIHHFLINSQNGIGHYPIIQPINAFFERFFVRENTLEKAEWDSALPTEEEKLQMQKVKLIFICRNAKIKHIPPPPSSSIHLDSVDYIPVPIG